MNIEISSERWPEQVVVPASKSYLNRGLILAALSTGELEGNFQTLPQDTKELIDALESLNLLIDVHPNKIIVHNRFPDCEDDLQQVKTIFLGEGGTTARFFLPLVALGNRTYQLEVEKHLSDRPFQEMFLVLKQLGAKLEFVQKENVFPVRIKGPIKINRPQKIVVDGGRSSQFISGLKLALACTKIKVEAVNLLASKKYVELTDFLIDEFQASQKINVKADLSGASYFFALGAVTGKMHIKNIFEADHFQADSILINWLEERGVKFSVTSEGAFLRGKMRPIPFDVDCSSSLDLVPTLAFLASRCEGKSIFRNIENLRFKESQRGGELEKLLLLFKIKNKLTQNSLEIWGQDKKSDFVTYQAPRDHRLIMAATLFMKVNNGGEIKNAEFVKKSFPDFFEWMES